MGVADFNSRNCFTNPGFEDDPDFSGWSHSADNYGVTSGIDNEVTYTGNAAVKITWNGKLAGVDPDAQNYWHTSQTLNVTPGETYKLSGYIKTENITCDECYVFNIDKWNGVRLLVQDADKKYGEDPDFYMFTTEPLYGTNEWKKVETIFTIPIGTTRIISDAKKICRRYNAKPAEVRAFIRYSMAG